MSDESFPITVRKVSLRFQRGSSNKEYHLILIATADNKGLVIKRWGKTGSWGQMDFLPSSGSQAHKAFEMLKTEKTRKGYEIIRQREGLQAFTIHDLQDLLSTPYFFKLGEHLQYLVPGADMTGQAKGEKVVWEETPDGKFKPADKPGPRLAADKPETIEDRYANDPRWGAFA